VFDTAIAAAMAAVDMLTAADVASLPGCAAPLCYCSFGRRKPATVVLYEASGLCWSLWHLEVAALRCRRSLLQLQLLLLRVCSIDARPVTRATVYTTN